MEESVGGILELVRHAGPGSGLLSGPESTLMPALSSDTETEVLSAVVPSPRNGGRADYGLQQDLLASLVRPPCHLEILIPSLNEAERLPRTLVRTIEYLEAQAYSSSLVVVDNGSIDQTVDLVRRTRSPRVPVTVIGCAQSGKGAAVRRGMRTSGARFVGYMDADLATPIETLDVVMPLLEQGSQAVVGSRHVDGAVFAERQPVLRLASGMAFRAIANRVLRGIADSQCGFKFFAGDLARVVSRHLSIDGFAFDVELLWTLIERGIPVTEIPVVWSDRKGSTLRLKADGARAIMDVLRLARRTVL
jgi:glycosyltransferase involved in cell wall biosynthesis